MNKAPVELKALTNEILFELKRAQALSISEQVTLFLLNTKHPWEALGKALTAFIEQQIQAIPKENRLKGKISPHAHLENPENIVVGEGAVIEAGAFITGPTFIEPHAVVRHGAYVRESTYICTKAVVGHTTESKGSLFLPSAKASHFNYVGDSIIGCDCNLGAGTKLANLKMNRSNIKLRFDGAKIDTQLKKFGAILGNRAQTGCNSVTNPGTIMFPETILLPNQTASGILKSYNYSV